MNIEKDIFKKAVINFKSIIRYCFTKNKIEYLYQKNILNNKFKILVEVNSTGHVKGKVMDLISYEEYTNYRVNNITGSLANEILLEFKKCLLDIKTNCSIQKYFNTEQANRISTLICKIYGDKPVFLWEKYSEYGVFKNALNTKLYVLIININLNKLADHLPKKDMDILNLKLNPDNIQKLLLNPGYYKAYHMNKANWITIILDDTVKDDILMELIKTSHQLTDKKVIAKF